MSKNEHPSRRRFLRGASLGLAGLSLAASFPRGAWAHADEAPEASNFALPRLVGGETLELSALRGAPVWLGFWASWCGPCRGELPELAAFHRRWKKRGLHVLGVSLDKDPEMARAALKRLHVRLPSVIDVAGSTVVPWNAARIPLNVLIDKDGRIVRRVEGYTPDLFEHAEGWVKPLLAS